MTKLLEDLKTILRAQSEGDQTRPLALALSDVREQLNQAGHTRITADIIQAALEELER
jgi:hypothetical protein